MSGAGSVPRGFEACGSSDLFGCSDSPNGGCDLQPRVAALRLPWVKRRLDIQPQRGCVNYLREFQGQRNRVAVDNDSCCFNAQGSRNGNPGLEAVAPLGHQSRMILTISRQQRGISGTRQQRSHKLAGGTQKSQLAETEGYELMPRKLKTACAARSDAPGSPIFSTTSFNSARIAALRSGSSSASSSRASDSPLN